MTDAIIITTTTGSRQDASRIAAALVEQRLAACAQVSGPIESTFRWQGQQETSEEWLVTIKTRSELYKAVEEAIRAAHSYEQPEILATPVVAGSRGYLQWLAAEVQQPEK